MNDVVVSTVNLRNPAVRISDYDKQHGNLQDMEFHGFCARMTERVQAAEAAGKPFFRTDADPAKLWEIYLSGFPDAYAKQYATCLADEQFIRNYGGLVTLEDGATKPLLWSPVETYTGNSVQALRYYVEKAKITGVFIPFTVTLGRPVVNDIWRNMHVSLSKAVLSEAGASAEEGRIKAERALVMQTLAEFQQSHFATFRALLATGAFTAPERFIPIADWWLGLYQNRTHNNIWNAVANVAPAWTHVKNSTMGACLYMLMEGKPAEEVKAFYNHAMDPQRHQRPVAPPTLGNIQVAEKKVADMGIEPSLLRRHALLDEIPEWRWKPKVMTPAIGGGVFDHLKAPKNVPSSLLLNAGVITLEKFLNTVLPAADAIHVVRQYQMQLGAIVTAVDPNAPPILQWDRPEQRNPFSSYTYVHPQAPQQWHLSLENTYEVLAIVHKPNEWFGGGFEHQGGATFFILRGARDSTMSGSALFPSDMRAELREVRSVVEAHSNRTPLKKMPYQQNAAGLIMDKGGYPVMVNVTSGNLTSQYRIDRAS